MASTNSRSQLTHFSKYTRGSYSSNQLVEGRNPKKGMLTARWSTQARNMSAADGLGNLPRPAHACWHFNCEGSFSSSKASLNLAHAILSLVLILVAHRHAHDSLVYESRSIRLGRFSTTWSKVPLTSSDTSIHNSGLKTSRSSASYTPQKVHTLRTGWGRPWCMCMRRGCWRERIWCRGWVFSANPPWLVW